MTYQRPPVLMMTRHLIGLRRHVTCFANSSVLSITNRNQYHCILFLENSILCDEPCPSPRKKVKTPVTGDGNEFVPNRRPAHRTAPGPGTVEERLDDPRSPEKKDRLPQVNQKDAPEADPQFGNEDVLHLTQCR